MAVLSSATEEKIKSIYVASLQQILEICFHQIQLNIGFCSNLFNMRHTIHIVKDLEKSRITWKIILIHQSIKALEIKKINTNCDL